MRRQAPPPLFATLDLARRSRPPEFGKNIPNKDLLTLQEAAPYLGYQHVESFRRVIRQGRSPVPIKVIGRRKYVRRFDLINYLWEK